SVGLEAQAVRVGVERGRVQVDAAEGTRLLAVGESGRFASRSSAAPPDPATAEPVPTPERVIELEPALVAGSLPVARPTPSASASWRNLAKDQNYVGALARLTAEGP